VLVRVLVDEAVDTGGTKSGGCNALALFTSPGSGSLTAAKRLDGSGYDGGFGSLFPFLLGLVAASAAATRTGAVSAASSIVTVTFISAIVTSVSRTRAAAARDGADDSTQTGSFSELFDVINDGLAAAVPGTTLILVGVISVALVVVTLGAAVIVVVIVIVIAAAPVGVAWLISFAITGLPVVGAWWRKVALDVLDAIFVAWAVDEVADWGALAAALNVGRLAHILGLPLSLPGPV
jgi:hypothetical protein